MNAILVLFPVTRGARGGRKRRNSSPDGDRIIGYCYLSPEEPGGDRRRRSSSPEQDHWML